VPVKQQFTVENRVLNLTNLDKVLYPAVGFTKADVIDYYTRVSKWLLPHLKDRPVTLKRFPDGVGGQPFYEKNAPRFTPEWVQTVLVPRRAGDVAVAASVSSASPISRSIRSRVAPRSSRLSDCRCSRVTSAGNCTSHVGACDARI
jgi:DNA primase